MNPFGTDAETLRYAATQAPLPALAAQLRRIAAALEAQPPKAETLAMSTEDRAELASIFGTPKAGPPELIPALRAALRELDARLRECFGQPISAEEAYDSFYQEIVADALAAMNEPPEPSVGHQTERAGEAVQRPAGE